MRIAVIGDFHIQLNELHVTETAMEDLAACQPDLVVPLGDFGSNDVIGGVEGLHQAHSFLRAIGAPLRPILGNHDLQRESGPGVQPKGTIEATFLELYGLNSAYGVMELEHVRLFFITTEPQPPESCYQIQECYVTDTQFDWMRRALAARPGVPCIVFSHAPPIGSGLRTVPHVHVRATNAYLDHNHDPDRWLTLIRSTPEIVVWMSAHFHLGHGHPDSSTEKYGTRFFTTGVHANVTRDWQRQSRLIELDDDRIRIYTVDHIGRVLVSEADWDGGVLSELVDRKRVTASEAAVAAFKDVGVGGSEVTLSQRLYTCSVGGPSAVLRRVLPLSDSRCLVVADDGYLWETDFQAEAVLGSLHLGEPLTDAVVAEDGVWRAWGRTLACSDPRHLGRFHRDAAKAKDELRLSFNADITFLSARKGEGVWVGCGHDLYEVVPERDGGVNRTACIRPVLVPAGESKIARLFERDGGRLQWVTAERQMWTWDRTAAPIKEREDVAAWDALGEEEASVRYSTAGAGMHLHYSGAEGTWTVPLPLVPGGSVDIVCLGQASALLLEDGNAWLWEARTGSIAAVDTGLDKVTAIARVGVGLSSVFSLTTAATDTRLPQLQVWRVGRQSTSPTLAARGGKAP